jgi:hypothetical protein
MLSMKKIKITLVCIWIALVVLQISMFAPTIVEARTITVGTISPNFTISVDTPVSFKIQANTGSQMLYTIYDSQPLSTISNANINAFGNFNWTPTQSDVGTHTLIITGIDSLGIKSTVTQTLVVTPPSSVRIFFNNSPSSVYPGKGVSFSIATPGYSVPSFYVTNSFVGATVSSQNIDAFGNFNWTPTQNDVGQHNLTIRVRGANNREETIFQTITVNGIAVEGTVHRSVQEMRVGNRFTFPIAVFGMQNPTYSVSDSARNNTIDSTNLNGTTFSWTPQNQDIGTHTITITAVEGNEVSKVVVMVKVVSGEVELPQSNTNIPSTIPSQTMSIQSGNKNENIRKFTFTLNLSVGSRGAEVIELQKSLTRLGLYKGPINGSFGPLTKTAVIKFQASKGIAKQGNVGPATRVALNKI